MTEKSIKTCDTFYRSTCGVCCTDEVNQYFSVDNNFIDYNKSFLSLREILSEALDFEVSQDGNKAMEICLDCKDKVVKFYHFKRKVKEVQKQNKNKTANTNKSPSKSQPNRKQSKSVHNIVNIVENFTKSHSVSSVRVEESNKRLVIESQNDPLVPCVKEEREDTPPPALESVDIKDEPELDFVTVHDDDSSMNKERGKNSSHEMKDEDSELDNDSRCYESSELGTSNAAYELSPSSSATGLNRAQTNEAIGFSDVWNYAQRTKIGQLVTGKCNFCGKVIVCSRSSTTSMKNHLKLHNVNLKAKSTNAAVDSSSAWRFATKRKIKGVLFGKCHRCKRIIKCASGRTFNLKAHLRIHKILI